MQELADYEQMSDGPKLTKEDLLRDGGFEDKSHHKFFHSFVAERISSSSSSDEVKDDVDINVEKGQTVTR